LVAGWTSNEIVGGRGRRRLRLVVDEMSTSSEVSARRTPRIVVMFSEIWTMIDARNLAELGALAAEAERAGVGGILIGEHVVMGPNAAENGLPDNPRDWVRNGNQDPEIPHPSSIPLLAAIAAVTSSVELMAVAYLAALRHPLDVAKQLATLDLISRGRAVVLPAVSWQEEEYAALGVNFKARGELLDEHLAVWDLAWRQNVSRFDGRHYRFDPTFMEPKPWSSTTPKVWIGGLRLHPRALRRTVRHGSGWFPTIPPSDEDLELLAGALAAAGRSIDELELGTWLGGDTPFPDARSVKPLKPALDAAEAHIDRGISTFVLKPSQYIDEPSHLADLCREAVRGIQSRMR
jgi:alkanesulfonate monooxygenase SsuD/methylene tetrahydromethanopterin reductase-like flavin-dependent oxidoreductase (luciferase family)